MIFIIAILVNRVDNSYWLKNAEKSKASNHPKGPNKIDAAFGKGRGIAEIYSTLGQKEKVMEWVQKAYEQRHP
jgi:hypothetical protein